MRPFLFLFLLIPFLFSCSHTMKSNLIDPAGPRIEIHFSYNRDQYPTIMGLKSCYPQVAIWAMEPDSGFEKTIYVTESSAANSWLFADERPAATPVWNAVKKREMHLDIDGISGATPSGETNTVVWPVPAHLLQKTITLYIEVNVSFDYNRYYTKGDSKETGSGVNGQPSLIWKAAVDLRRPESEYTPVLIGHGDVQGTSGAIDANLDTITTAKALFGQVVVRYRSGTPQ